MSAKLRHFLFPDGRIRSSVRPEPNMPDGYPEVQVVPLDAIVIRRDELPEVTHCDGSTGPTDALRTVHGWSKPLGPSWHRDLALHQLALAEYQEHPPVDEAQVAAVRDALLSADSDDVNYIEGDDAWKLARRMVEHFGVRVEAKS